MKAIVVLALFWISFFTVDAFARDIHLYVATGPNFAGLASARLGVNDVEVGLITPGSPGVAMMFRDKGIYSAFGATYYYFRTLGFYAGLGFDWDWFAGLSMRGELYAQGAISGELQGAGQIGFQYRF